MLGGNAFKYSSYAILAAWLCFIQRGAVTNMLRLDLTEFYLLNYVMCGKGMCCKGMAHRDKTSKNHNTLSNHKTLSAISGHLKIEKNCNNKKTTPEHKTLVEMKTHAPI